MMILVAAAGIGLGGLARWYKTHAIMTRRIAAARVSAQRGILDLLWEPADDDLVRRAHRINYSGQPITDATLAAMSKEANPGVLDLARVRSPTPD